MRLVGFDPGLRVTGWGVIDVDGNRLIHVANGTVGSSRDRPLAERLLELHEGVTAVIERYEPAEAAVEETFVNQHQQSTLKLGLARGAVLLAPARRGLKVAEYGPNMVKKAIVGTGHAAKEQVQAMVLRLLPGCDPSGADAADALAVAICHAHHAASRRAWGDGAAVVAAPVRRRRVGW